MKKLKQEKHPLFGLILFSFILLLALGIFLLILGLNAKSALTAPPVTA